MNSLNLPFQHKEKQVDTLMVLHSVQDVIAVLPTGYRKQGTGRVQSVSSTRGSKHGVHDREIIQKMGYNLCESGAKNG